MGPHHGVRHRGLDRNQVCLIGFGHNLVVFDRHVQLAFSDIAAVAAGIEEGARVGRFHIRPMIVARQNEIDSLHQAEGIQALGLQHSAIAATRPGMHHNDHHVRMLLRTDLVHIGLDHVHDGHKMHPAPEFLGEPGFHVRVGITQDGDLQARFPDDLVRSEIRLPVIIPDGVRRQEIHAVLLEVLSHAVIHRMARLDVVIAHGHCIIPHVGHQAGKQMRCQRINIVEKIRSVVPLKAVAGIQQQDVLRTICRPDTVNIVFHRRQRRACPAIHIGGIEPGAMDVVGGQDGQGIFAVLERAAAGKRQEGAGGKKQVSNFHDGQFISQRFQTGSAPAQDLAGHGQR